MHTPVITIDGPAGSGKGTIASLLADKLGWHLLDSGAIYRVAAEAALSGGVSLEDESALVAMLGEISIRFDAGKVWRNGVDVSHAIRTQPCSDATSRISVFPGVRSALLACQQAFRVDPGLIADGRDMGTVVFPDAPVKIFLTASPAVRAERRLKQLSQQGISANLPTLILEIAARDERDSSRPVAPLRPAEDALIIDSSCLAPDQVVELILQRL